MKRRAFKRQKRPDGRYGPAFEAVRKLPCFLWTLKYYGLGHQCCGYGAQGGHTACHLGYLDEDGLLPGCGKAHDLVARLGGRSTLAAFDEWMEANHVDLKALGLRYYKEATDAEPMG